MKNTLDAFWKFLLAFLRWDAKETLDTLRSIQRPIAGTIALELAGIAGFCVTAILTYESLWYLGCIPVVLAASVRQFYILAEPAAIVIANMILLDTVTKIVSRTLSALKQPGEKISAVSREIRERIAQIINQPSGEVGDAILSAINQTLRAAEIPEAAVSMLVNPVQTALNEFNTTVQNLPGSAWGKIKLYGKPVLSAFLVFQWASTAFWLLLAFTPNTDSPIPMFVVLAGVLLAGYASTDKGEWRPIAGFDKKALYAAVIAGIIAIVEHRLALTGHWHAKTVVEFAIGTAALLGAIILVRRWKFRFGVGVVVACVGVWGMIMPDYWTALEGMAKNWRSDSHKRAQVIISAPKYRLDGRIFRAITGDSLRQHQAVRLAKASQEEDPKGNKFVKALGIIDPSTGMVPIDAETFWFPVLYLTLLEEGDDLPPFPGLPGNNHTLQNRLDPHALWDYTKDPAEKVVSFNAGGVPIAVFANTRIAHPLGDHRITPVIHYGIVRQWNSKREWSCVFPAPRGSMAYAAADGRVIAAYPVAKGRVSGITIRHDLQLGTFYTRSSEMGELFVSAGDIVQKGQPIGRTDGSPGSYGARSDAREPHLRFEVWAMTQRYSSYIPVDPMTWIEGVEYQKIEVGPKEFLAYPLYPLPGTENEYEFPVNRPCSCIADRIPAEEYVRAQILEPEFASYVLNAQKEREHWYREPITIMGKEYPYGPDNATPLWQLFRFYTSRERATYGQLIAGMNGFENARGMSYGALEFYAEEEGQLCFAINDIIAIRATGEQVADRSADNYVKHGTRDVVRIKVTIGLNGST